MHVTSDGGDDDLTVGLSVSLLLLHVGSEDGDGLLHDTGGLNDLREEHLALTEEIADSRHAGHQRALNDLEGAGVVAVGAGLLHVALDELLNTLHQRVGEALGDGAVTPLVNLDGLLTSLGVALSLLLLGISDEGLGGVGVAVEDGILDELQEVGGDVSVDGQRAGVDNGHIDRAVADSLIQEGAVHRHTNLLETAEGEGKVRETTADAGVGEVLLDPQRGLENVNGVVVVLLHTGADSQHVGIEDDILRGEVDLLGEELVGARADADLVVAGSGLSLLVEGHDNNGSAVAADKGSLVEELLLANLEGDGVDDSLALSALETGLDDVELGGVNHQRDLSNIGVGGEEVDEAGHGGDTVDETIIHVDVNDHRALLDLLAGNGKGGLVLTLTDEAAELSRTRNVATLTNVGEDNLGGEAEGLEAGEGEHVVASAAGAGDDALHRVADSADVVGAGAAATADDVEPSVAGVLGEGAGHLLRGLIVAAHSVGEASIGVARGEHLGELRHALDIGTHLLAAEGAVDTAGEDVAVADRGVEGVHRLAREGTAGKVSDRAGDEEGDLGEGARLEDAIDGEDAGLAVEGIEDGLNEEHINAALEEGRGLLSVGDDHLVVGDVTEVGALDGGGDGGSAVEGAETAGNEAAATGASAHLISGLAAEAGGLKVHALDEELHLKISLRDSLRVEGVRLNNISASLEVLDVDLLDDVGVGEDKEVIVALHVAMIVLELLAAVVSLLKLVALDHGTHTTIEDEDALVASLLELGVDGRDGDGHSLLFNGSFKGGGKISRFR